MTFQEELKNLGERSGERALTESIIAAYEALLESDSTAGTKTPEVWLHVGNGYDRVPLSEISKAIRDYDRLTLWSFDKDILDKAKSDFDGYFNPYYIKTGKVLEEDDLPYWSLDIMYNDVVKGNKAQLTRLYNKITDYVNDGPEPGDDGRIGTSDGIPVYRASPEMSRELRQAMGESVETVPVTTSIPDSKVYVSADGSQVLGLTWGDDPQNIDPDLDEDDPESYLAQGYNCYTYADLYDVDEGFDLSQLPADPWELDSLEGKGLSLVANMEQHMYKKSELPSEEDALGEYVNPDDGWKVVSK